MEVIFRGGEADEHRIELHEGAESLAGLGRVSTLVAHYISTGQVKYRGPYSSVLSFYIRGTRDGSLGVAIEQVAKLANEAAAAAAKLKSSKLLSRVTKRALGQAPEGPLDLDGEIVPAGTIDALAEAATPGLTRAHRWVSFAGKSISIDPEGAQTVRLDQDTKQYLESEEYGDGRETQDVSVGALNVNSRNGRVFFHDLGRTLPFWVSRDASPRTIPTLARYLTQYAEKTGATVNIEFLRVKYPDGRLKRLIVFDCYSLEDAA